MQTIESQLGGYKSRSTENRGAEVKLREYGVRGVYRQPIGKPYLFGDLILGYTWPRFERDEPRDGSVTFGLGVELLFGRKPY